MLEKIGNILSIVYFAVAIICVVFITIFAIYAKSAFEDLEDDLVSHCIDTYYKDVLKESEVSE